MSAYTDETNDDINGHGTHVAGIIGAQKYGVAPFANLINVKVLGKGGNTKRIAQVRLPSLDLSLPSSVYLLGCLCSERPKLLVRQF